MAIKIGIYNFEGSFNSTNSLRKQSGVYVILGRNTDAETWKVVDIGEAGDVQKRVADHDRSDCWKRQGYQRPLQAAVLYCNELDRMRIEHELRPQFNPPCGRR